MTQLEQKPVALVTGGAQGIGLGITEYLLTQGWRVAIADVNEAGGNAAQEKLAKFRDALIFVRCAKPHETTSKQPTTQREDPCFIGLL